MTTGKEETHAICDSHLAIIDTRKRRKYYERNFVAFKCFWGANAK